MAVIQNSKSVKQIAAANRVRLWDLKTGQYTEMERSRYDKIAKGFKTHKGNANTGMGGVLPEWLRRHYITEDYPGQKIVMIHLGTQKVMSDMTLPLLMEIKKRNPPENVKTYDNSGNKISDTFEWWMNFLATPEEVQPYLPEEVQAGVYPIKEEPKKVQEHHEKKEIKVTKPKVGRRKKQS